MPKILTADDVERVVARDEGLVWPQRETGLRFLHACPPLKFACPICRLGYDTVAEMLQCLNKPVPKSTYKAGDLVVVPVNFHIDNEAAAVASEWYAGTIPANPGAKSHFDHRPHHLFWWVITAVYTCHDQHREAATVVTLGLGLKHGWNPTDREHYPLLREDRTMPEWVNLSEYWRERFDSLTFRSPTKKLRDEAAKLAAKQYVSDSLL